MIGYVKLKDNHIHEYFNQSHLAAKASLSLGAPLLRITDCIAPESKGGKHDYYSNDNACQSDSGRCFDQHRLMLRRLKMHVAQLAAAYALTRQEVFAAKAVSFLQEFFLNEETRMNPNLQFAQANQDIADGSGKGIINTLHIIDLVAAIETLQASDHLTENVLGGLKQWFESYLNWMRTHQNAVESMNADNHRSIVWFVQAAAFARFTGNEPILKWCREQYKTRLLPNQMHIDGSFASEMKSRRPYTNSVFALDNLVTLCHIASAPDNNLWEYELPDGRGIRQGMDFLFPYLVNKTAWSYSPDTEYLDAWPVGMSFLLFSGLALNRPDYISLWKSLEKDPQDAEVRQHMAIRQPILWLLDSFYAS